MTEEEKKAVIQCVSLVAWADGSISEQEKDEMTNLVKSIGDLDEGVIKDILANEPEKKAVLSSMVNFHPELAMQVLNFCYRLAVQDNKIHKNEIETIRSIAALYWHDDDLETVMTYLKRNYEAEQLYFRLVIVPQLAAQKAG